MENIIPLFQQFLNPERPNPEAGSQLFEKVCGSVELLFDIIQNLEPFRMHGLVFLKRVLDFKLDSMSTDERKRIFDFTVSILIPNILPQNPIMFSPKIYEIFYNSAEALSIDFSSLFSFIANLKDPCFLPFIITFLINTDLTLIDLQYSLQILAASLQISDPNLLKFSFELFVIICNTFSESIQSEFVDPFVQLANSLSCVEIWNFLSDLTKPFSTAFIPTAMPQLLNPETDFELRLSIFHFVVDHLESIDLKDFSQLLTILFEFQLLNLNEIDDIDRSLFLLYQNSLNIPEMKLPTFELYKTATFQLLGSDRLENQFLGLFSLAFLIDNAPELSLFEEIPSDLSLFHPYLTSGHQKSIEAVFEVLTIMIGKPLASHYDFQPIFQDIIPLFLSATDLFIRNKAAAFSYEFLQSKFVYTFWVFETFLPFFSSVQFSELSVYLEILAKSILPNCLNVSDDDINKLVQISTEIITSETITDTEVKIGAASLCCSLIQKEPELAFEISELATSTAFNSLCYANETIEKTISECLIRFMKCTNGNFNHQFRDFVPALMSLSMTKENLLSNFYYPVLFTEMIRRDPEIPTKEVFFQVLLNTISNPINNDQYEIASLCLKKIVYQFPIETQSQIATHICQNIFTVEFFKLVKSSIAVLTAMLKLMNSQECREQVAQIVANIFHPFDDDIVRTYIGSLCRLGALVIRTLGANIPENLKSFCYQLIQKTLELPAFYSNYTFFLFANYIKYSVVDSETITPILVAAFNQLNGSGSNLDVSCSLLVIKATIERYPEILNQERMNILVECWKHINSNVSLICSSSYLGNILIFIGCNNLLPPELFVSAIQAFPFEVKKITAETCQLILDYFRNIDGKDPNVVREIVFGIIRLLSAGKSIRYKFKLELEQVIALIKLAINLSAAIQLDLAESVAACLRNSPRKQKVVMDFFRTFLS